MAENTSFGFPFSINEAGRINATGGDEAIRGKIIQVLFTAPGGRVNLPEFGCGLFDLVFEPNNAILALEIGSENAESGMSMAIYQEIDRLLSPPLQQAVDDAQTAARAGAQEALDVAREGWRKLSYAIAQGVINHLTANMEILGVETQGDVNTTVSGSTGPAPPVSHVHAVSLSGTQNDVVFTQSNDGTGHVR